MSTLTDSQIDELWMTSIPPGQTGAEWRRKFVRSIAAALQSRDREDAARYHRWLAAHSSSTSEHWSGRRSIVIEGPAPKSHNSEDDFDAAIDAARRIEGERK